MCRPWNYPYQSYRGFITGEIAGWVALTIAHDPFYQTLFSSAKNLLDHANHFSDNLWNINAYRQRNVFLYPPQDSNVCDSANDAVKGDGVCGVNGNTKIFEADQVATTCSGGGIEGPYQGLSTYSACWGRQCSTVSGFCSSLPFGLIRNRCNRGSFVSEPAHNHYKTSIIWGGLPYKDRSEFWCIRLRRRKHLCFLLSGAKGNRKWILHWAQEHNYWIWYLE